MRILLLLILAAVASGCAPKRNGHSSSAPPPSNQVLVLDEAKALAIARQAVATNDTWLDQAEFEKPRHETNGSGWSVLVWRLPETPGGHRLIQIDENGKVTGYMRGR